MQYVFLCLMCAFAIPSVVMHNENNNPAAPCFTLRALFSFTVFRNAGFAPCMRHYLEERKAQHLERRSRRCSAFPVSILAMCLLPSGESSSFGKMSCADVLCV